VRPIHFYSEALTTTMAAFPCNSLAKPYAVELVGPRATLARHNLDRFWRDARTHTLRDLVRRKYSAVGQYYLNSMKPPLHS